MSIKQSIAALLLFIGVSFNASSSDQYITLNRDGGNSHLVTGCSGWSVGDTVKVGVSDSLSKPFNGGKCTHISTDSTGAVATWKYGDRTHHGYIYGDVVGSCPDGEIFNPSTNKCEEPPYCDRESTLSEIQTARNECESSGKQFSFSCSNETESWEGECNGRDCSDVEGGAWSGPMG